MLECMEIIAIATQKGLHLHAVKGAWQLDGTMQSKLIAMAFAMAAELDPLHPLHPWNPTCASPQC
jgi:hypothetical protein